ncbi:MAG: hypothetical protein J6W86_01185 [Bacteroidales bacterium]|jgi:hypothetical protein|nr:hypothetical protein [Bacteroidales bacterium]
MKKIILLSAIFFLALGSVSSFAQNSDKQPTPEEMAEKETKNLAKRLNLTEAQEFYVDSILVANYVGVVAALEDLKNSGMQDPETYRRVNEQWQQKNLAALKKVLDEQQYIGYLRYIGKGKDYKKGKDGKWYLKSELKKQNKNSQ